MTADDRLSPLRRELACLALGHLDADRTTCSRSADDLVADLVIEVHRLRVITGDEGLDGEAAATALDLALTEVVGVAEVPDHEQAVELLDHLAGQGWALVKVDQR